MCSIKGCNLKKFEDKDKCIFHCKKDDWYDVTDNGNKNLNKTEENQKTFWNELNRMINDFSNSKRKSVILSSVGDDQIIIHDINIPKISVNYLDKKIINYTFSGCEFFNGFKLYLTNDIQHNFEFLGCLFKDKVYIRTSNKNKIVGKLNFFFTHHEKDIFIESSVTENINIKGINRKTDRNNVVNIFIRPLHMGNSLEIKEIYISDLLDSQIKNIELNLINADKINIINSRERNFSFDLKLERIKSNTITLYNLALGVLSFNSVFTTKEENSNYFKLNLDKLIFINTDFEDDKIHDLIVKKEIQIIDSDLNHTKLSKINLNTSKIIIKDSSFYNIILDSIKWPSCEMFFASRDTFRQLKLANDWQGNIIEANKFYKLEMEKREEELSNDIKNGKNFFEYIVFLFHSITSNHSQNWLLSLFWIIISTFGYVLLSKYEFNSNITFGIWVVLSIFLVIVIGTYLNYYSNDKFSHTVKMFVLLILFYCAYSFILDDFVLKEFSTNVNPFSVFNQNGKLSFLELIYRIIIAYLIYQLIISIRQNTRRK